MKNFWKRLGALALAGGLLFSGCVNTTPSPSGEAPGEKTAAAMGRYIEEEVTVPEGMGYMAGFHQQADGTLEILANRNSDVMVGEWMLFTSTDGGRSWTDKADAFLHGLGEYTSVNAAGWDKDDNLYINFQTMTQEYYTAARANDVALMQTLAPPESRFVRLDTDGTATDLPDTPSDENGSGARSFRAAENGDLLAECYFSIVQFDPADGVVKFSYKPTNFDGMTPNSYDVYGNTLLLSDGNEVAVYDVTTGERMDSIPVSVQENVQSGAALKSDKASPLRAITTDLAQEAIYVADKTGIYRRPIGGSLTERILDGELTSLNMPAFGITDMVACPNGDFLVLTYADEGRKLFSYTYSVETPTVPATELRVFSLYENETIRQAMGTFQREHPDVRVVFDVAIGADSAVSVSDALRTLSTRLLADDGPDLIVLDGMPLDSYIEKGVLLDITETVESRRASGEWLANMAGSFARDGKVYAVPARFTVPVVVTTPAGAAQKDFSAFIDWIIAEQETLPMLDAQILDNLSPPALIEQFYATCAPAWFDAQGKLDEEAMRVFLTALKRLTDTLTPDEKQGHEAAYAYKDIVYSPMWSSVSWAFGRQPAAVVDVNALYDLATPDAAIKKHGDGLIAPQPGQTDGTFVPRTVLGVNAAGKQTPLALEFLEKVLSEPVQFCDFSDGMPVNAAAFAARLKTPYAEGDDGTYLSMGRGTVLENGEEVESEPIEMQVLWPTDAFMRETTGWMTALDRPSFTNAIVKQMVLDETAGFFDGSKTLDETLQVLSEKLNLYLSE